MRLQSTVIHGALESAFLDELSKIAEVNGTEKDNRWVTKKKLKRLLAVAIPAAAGTGLGYGAAKAVESQYLQNKFPVLKALHNHVGKSRLRKYGPMVVGGLGATAAALAALKSRKVKKYLDE
jgi:hypothetical protein